MRKKGQAGIRVLVSDESDHMTAPVPRLTFQMDDPFRTRPGSTIRPQPALGAGRSTSSQQPAASSSAVVPAFACLPALQKTEGSLWLPLPPGCCHLPWGILSTPPHVTLPPSRQAPTFTSARPRHNAIALGTHSITCRPTVPTFDRPAFHAPLCLGGGLSCIPDHALRAFLATLLECSSFLCNQGADLPLSCVVPIQDAESSRSPSARDLSSLRVEPAQSAPVTEADSRSQSVSGSSPSTPTDHLMR